MGDAAREHRQDCKGAARVIDRVTLGRTGLAVSRIGLASNGLPGEDVEYAVERGINYLYWGSLRLPQFGAAVRRLARRRREELVIVVQTYSRAAALLRPSLELALRRLGIDDADLLLLGWWNHPPPARILDAALELRDAGKTKHVMISCHERKTFRSYIEDPTYGAIMVRYNAAHPGAEEEVFPWLQERTTRPGVVTYTATRWGALLDPRLLPDSEPAPRASDCYRFALSHPAVNVTLCGAKNRRELAEALAALERGPMDPEELHWMKRVGAAVKERTSVSRSGNVPIYLLDRLTAGVRARP
jgi:aryl-alcohol dehydrogenase-like predicted oxidoreductase